MKVLQAPRPPQCCRVTDLPFTFMARGYGPVTGHCNHTAADVGLKPPSAQGIVHPREALGTASTPPGPSLSAPEGAAG